MNHLNPSTGSSSRFAPMSGRRQRSRRKARSLQEPHCRAPSIGVTLRPGRRPAIGFWSSTAKPAPRPISACGSAPISCATKAKIWERGAFYEPDVLSEDELAILRQVIDDERSNSDGERICLRTRAEFVDEVFYRSAYAVGAQIVGFNLPFDLSRLAIRHASARRSMKGGFSLTLSERLAAVAVKHLSQRAALIRFTGDRPATETTAEEESDDDPDDETPDETEKKVGPDRGYFVDVKTLAAALTSKSHSLASLSELLKVPTPKKESDEHGGALTPDYVRYGLRDVQTTWECFDVLARRFASFGLHETGLYELYSEASLGKAYLRAMRIKPWQEVQRGFPLHLVGAIMSAYFGGRAEVHIRRQITPVVHTDFLSMYPTVCTLMGLWSFVRANGMTHHDDTNAVTALARSTARGVGGASSQERRLERPGLVGSGAAEE